MVDEDIFFLDEELHDFQLHGVQAGLQQNLSEFNGIFPSEEEPDTALETGMNSLVVQDTQSSILLEEDTPAPSNGTLPLIRMPFDFHFQLLGHLSLADKYILSQACRFTRDLAGLDWRSELNQLTADKRLKFWTDVAYALPDQWVCPNCCRLHRVDFGDTPQSDLPPSICTAGLFPRAYMDPDVSQIRRYEIRHCHVQLALKYTRLGRHKEYVERLMKPLRTSWDSLNKGSFVTPVIINERFIIKQWFWICTSERLTREKIATLFLRLCPHCYILPL